MTRQQNRTTKTAGSAVLSLAILQTFRAARDISSKSTGWQCLSWVQLRIVLRRLFKLVRQSDKSTINSQNHAARILADLDWIVHHYAAFWFLTPSSIAPGAHADALTLLALLIEMMDSFGSTVAWLDEAESEFVGRARGLSNLLRSSLSALRVVADQTVSEISITTFGRVFQVKYGKTQSAERNRKIDLQL